MATTTTDTTQPEPQAALSHLVKRLLKQEGGAVGVERVTLRISDYVDVSAQEAASLIEEGTEQGVYSLGRGTDGERQITGVSPVGSEPEQIAAAFDDQPAGSVDFTRLPEVSEPIATALEDAGYGSFRDLADADPATVATEVEQTIDAHVEPADFTELQTAATGQITSDHITALKTADIETYRDLAAQNVEALVGPVDDELDDIVDPFDFSQITVISETQAEKLTDAGYETLRDLAGADPEDVADLAPTLTTAKAEKAIEVAVQKTVMFDEELAAEILEKAEARAAGLTENDAEAVVATAAKEIPMGIHLAERAAEQRKRRINSHGDLAARTREIDTVTEPVGDPRYRTDPDLGKHDDDAVYMSDLGQNAADPVNTGLHVLDDPDHPLVPKTETHSDAGAGALPVDDDGDVIPPAVPPEEHLQLPMDELVAKKLARGLKPVRIVGPRGCGKNYLLKYICHQTNRGYLSLDVDQATTPEDLFGPLTPTEDGVIVPRAGPIKQGLLTGATIVINEFPVMQAGAAMSLHQLLNEGTLLVKAHGELVEPHAEARIVITMNPPTREYRDSEPMNSATRGRFRGFKQTYPQSVDAEVETLYEQVNTDREVVSEEALTKIVQVAHQTRQNETWPTLSTRNLTIVCEHIADGASPKAALKNELWAVAEPNQYPEDAHDTLNDYL